MANRTPKGWSKTDLTAFAGNILDPASYSKLAMLLSYEILKSMIEPTLAFKWRKCCEACMTYTHQVKTMNIWYILPVPRY